MDKKDIIMAILGLTFHIINILLGQLKTNKKIFVRPTQISNSMQKIFSIRRLGKNHPRSNNRVYSRTTHHHLIVANKLTTKCLYSREIALQTPFLKFTPSFQKSKSPLLSDRYDWIEDGLAWTIQRTANTITGNSNPIPWPSSLANTILHCLLETRGLIFFHTVAIFTYDRPKVNGSYLPPA